MFGKYQAIFRSRWRALIWAGGVCLTAYCTVPRADETPVDPAQAQAEAKAVAVLAGIAGAEPQEKPKKHINPWALPPEQQKH